MKIIYQLFLAFNSTWLIVVVFLVKEKFRFTFLNDFHIYHSWLLFVLIPVALTAFSFLIAKRLPKDSLQSTSVKEIELANNNFLPTYLGYFFVSLGVEDIETLIVVFLIIYVFTCLSQTLYFNPLFLLFGFHFYFLTTSANVRIFLITRQKLRTPGDHGFEGLKRINNYTYLDL